MNIASTKQDFGQPAGEQRPRVLHVLGSLGLGGIETWLMHMLRHRDQFSVEHEVLLTKEEAGEYEDEVRRMGVRIHKLPAHESRRAWLRGLRAFLRTEGPYSAVHSHMYLFSAAVLAAAKAEHVPVRIAHCHTARSRGSDHQTLRHKLRRAGAIFWLKRVATRRLGISDAAIEEIAGSSWRSDEAASVLLYGFDFSPYHGAADRAGALRSRLGIAKEAPVVGHVGRFEPVKNHAFLLQSFDLLSETLPSAKLVLVGNGPIRAQLVSMVEDMGLSDKVCFAGTTNDVAAYMRMFDLFALPSFSEGLGIVVVEAQAAGTPSIVSNAVAKEAEVVPGAVTFQPLASGPEQWASAMTAALEPRRPHEEGWLEKVEASCFAIGRCIRELDEIYVTELARTR